MLNFYARVKNGLVVDVVVLDNEKSVVDNIYFITHQNIRGGNPEKKGMEIEKHKLKRKNFARVGFRYDKELDAFIPPQPYPSWRLDESSCLWNAPIPYPQDDKQYIWNEAEQEWTYTGYYINENNELVKEES